MLKTKKEEKGKHCSGIWRLRDESNPPARWAPRQSATCLAAASAEENLSTNTFIPPQHLQFLHLHFLLIKAAKTAVETGDDKRFH